MTHWVVNELTNNDHYTLLVLTDAVKPLGQLNSRNGPENNTCCIKNRPSVLPYLTHKNCQWHVVVVVAFIPEWGEACPCRAPAAGGGTRPVWSWPGPASTPWSASSCAASPSSAGRSRPAPEGGQTDIQLTTGMPTTHSWDTITHCWIDGVTVYLTVLPLEACSATRDANDTNHYSTQQWTKINLDSTTIISTTVTIYRAILTHHTAPHTTTTSPPQALTPSVRGESTSGDSRPPLDERRVMSESSRSEPVMTELWYHQEDS